MSRLYLSRGYSKGSGRAHAKALLDACDRRRAIGRSDYAVIHQLSACAEVAALTLDGIDWRAAGIVVAGKVESLPARRWGTAV